MKSEPALLEMDFQLERVPPVTVTSASSKSETTSEREKVREAVSPAFREARSDEMAMDGRRVSTLMVTELLASEPSRLRLPNEFENVPDLTEMTASVVLFGVGVNVVV